MSGCGAIRQALHVLGLGVVLLLPLSPLTAQTMTNSFGGMSKNSDAPIDIKSDTLTVFDAKKIAIFKGRVKAVQGTTTLRAAQLEVHYVGDADTFAGQGGETTPAAAPSNRAFSSAGRSIRRESSGVNVDDDAKNRARWLR